MPRQSRAPQAARPSWEDDAGDSEAHSEAAVAEADSDVEQGDWPGLGEQPSSDDEPEDPGVELVNHMMEFYLLRKLSSQDFCIAMYWASKSGIDAAKLYARPPGLQSGKYERHMKKVFGAHRRSSLYRLRAPGFIKGESSRHIHAFDTIPLHEALLDSIGADDTYRMKLQEAIDDNALPDCYFENHVVKAHIANDVVAPFGIFLDGVPYADDDSVVGAWAFDVLRGRRILLAIFRKRLMCRCGCRHWCTLYEVMDWLAWSVKALAEGTYPEQRHDKAPFSDNSDTERLELAGKRMIMRCCLLYIKGDWMELCTTFGFPNWGDSLRCCVNCTATKESRNEVGGCTLDALVWTENNNDTYFDACRACELVRTVTQEHHEAICRILFPDKRNDGSHGLALIEDFPPLGLRQHDRLEPCEACRDVHNFLHQSSFPIRGVVFWRVSEETASRHRNPIFIQELGITPTRNLVWDAMHAIYLGIMNTLCKNIVWLLLSSDTLATVGTQDERIAAAIVWLDSDLDKFYKSRAKTHRTENLTRITAFTSKTVCTVSEAKLAAKAAHTYGFFDLPLRPCGAPWRKAKRRHPALV